MASVRFDKDSREFFEGADAQTRADALPVLQYLAHGFSVSSFREQNPRIWSAIIKPDDNVREQFGLTLEYFLIGHGFPGDFHQRTLMAAPPPKEAYRLDAKVRFVASPSPLLRGSCAAWAVQNSIAVVPIEAAKIASVSDPETHLYSSLASTLWRRDVFDDPEPVTNPAEFFGREQITNEVVEKVLLGQPCALFGLRKIGKTSLLRRIRELLESDPGSTSVTALVVCNAARIKSGRWSAALVDLLEQWSRSINEASQAACLKTEVRGLKLPSLLGVGKPFPSDAAIAEAFEKDVQRILRAARSVAGASGSIGVRLIAFFDEADQLYPTRPDAGHWRSDYFALWDTLQALKRGLDDPAELVYVLGGVNPAGTETGSLLDRPNPLFELSTLFLGPLPQDESESLLTGLGERIGLRFTSSALSRAYAITGGHPWLLRKLGSKIHRDDIRRSALKSITDSEVDRVFARTRRSFYSHIDWILTHLKSVAPEEFKLLSDLAQGGEERYWTEWQDKSFREVFADHLESYGLLRFDGSSPVITIALVAEALVEPVAQLFPEQKAQLREAADSLEATIRTRLVIDLCKDRSVEEAVDLIVGSIPKEARNRPKSRDELRILGLEVGMRAMVESLNWGDYLVILERHTEEISWAATSLTQEERIALLKEAVMLLHLARHNNDAELQQVITERSFPDVYRKVRQVNELLIA